MKRVATAVILAGAAWLGLATEARAQVLITTTGPLSVKAPVIDLSIDASERTTHDYQFYPGRTMGGGTRFLRTNPPPSSLKRRKE